MKLHVINMLFPKITICGYIFQRMTEDFSFHKPESRKQQKFSLTKGWG